MLRNIPFIILFKGQHFIVHPYSCMKLNKLKFRLSQVLKSKKSFHLTHERFREHIRQQHLYNDREKENKNTNVETGIIIYRPC